MPTGRYVPHHSMNARFDFPDKNKRKTTRGGSRSRYWTRTRTSRKDTGRHSGNGILAKPPRTDGRAEQGTLRGDTAVKYASRSGNRGRNAPRNQGKRQPVEELTKEEDKRYEALVGGGRTAA